MGVHRFVRKKVSLPLCCFFVTHIEPSITMRASEEKSTLCYDNSDCVHPHY